jgi:long-subunit fatty acid transport protein
LAAALGLGPAVAPAGVWTVEPKLSLSAEYGSNPDLLVTQPLSESDGAVLAELPTTYTAGGDSFALLPRLRLGTAHSYASYNSNYWYLDAVAAMNHERFQGSVTAGASSDSTLHSGLEALQIGKPNTRRDGREASANGQYAVTERLSVAAGVNWTRALFPVDSGLDSFDYTAGSLNFQYALTPRLSLTAGAGDGRLHGLAGATDSTTENWTVGAKFQVSQIWNLSLSAGNAREADSYYLPMSSTTEARSVAVYGATLARQSERSTFTVTANRSVQPTGFGVLAVETLASAAESYQASERWTLSASVQWSQSKSRAQPAVIEQRTRVDSELNVVWHWRPQWDVVMRATRTNFHYQSLGVDEMADSNGIYFLLTRLFGPRLLW